MGTFRSSAYEALIAVLLAQRIAIDMTQEELADGLPRWLGFDHTTINKIEHGRRNVSFVEAREIGKVLGLTVAQIDRRTQQHGAGKTHDVVRRAKRKRKR
jgi:DNA-binding XRE family transcriptional regulator